MTITEFLDVVRAATLRGNALDSQIGYAFRQAVGFIERNYNFPYMRSIITQSVTTGVLLTGDEAKYLKAIQRVRWQDSSGNWQSIVQIDPDQLVSDEGDNPSGYEYFETTDSTGAKTVTLTFDVAFEDATTVELLCYSYTEVDLGNPGNQGIWLINHAEDALLHRTMINLAPVLRDATVLQMYQQLWMESSKTLIGAADSLEQGAR